MIRHHEPNPFADPSTSIKSLHPLLSTSKANSQSNSLSCRGLSTVLDLDSNKENIDLSSQGQVLDYQSRAQSNDSESSRWATKPPTFLYNTATMPSSRRDFSVNWPGTRLQAQMPSPNSDTLLNMIKEKLRLDPSDESPSSPPDVTGFGARSASSEYPQNDANLSRIQSPTSTVHVNHLSMSDLSRFGHGNDRLSFLLSSSQDSSAQQARRTQVGDRDDGACRDKTSTGVSSWQDAKRAKSKPAYNHYELADSNDVLPCDSLSQCVSPQLSAADRQENSGAAVRTKPGVKTWECEGYVHVEKHGQYDGAGDSWDGSPKPETPPPFNRLSKRKASHFSLRSLSQSFSKRPRLTNLQKWAHQVCRSSSRRLSRAYHRWRQQNEIHRQQYEAWKANRRRERPADPLKGKSGGGFGAFSIERTRHGNEDWWKEGVARYQAPEWMLFQK